MDKKQSLDPIWCLVDFKLLIIHEQTVAAERHWLKKLLITATCIF